MGRNKQNGLLGEIITLAILILLIFLSNVETSKVSYLEGLGSKIINPIQKIFVDLKSKVTSDTNYFDTMEKLKEENKTLKEENKKLEESIRELEVLKAEKNTLEEYLNLTQKYSNYEAIPAYVINRDISNYSGTIILNVGSKDGVAEDMTVIADKGLVGHVISVTETTAKVQVIVDSASTVSATMSTVEESIICKGTLEDNKILRASYIPTGAELIIGDTIQTSGLGGIYPKGILIGTISKIVTTNNSTDRYAVIQTAVDFSKVYSVLVIKK